MAKKEKQDPNAAEGKAEGEAPAEGAVKEKKAKEPKEAKEGKPKKARISPDAPAAGEAPPAADGAPPAPAPRPSAPGEEKKRGKAPGRGPRRGKKLRARVNDLQQKIAKEAAAGGGAAPLKRAVQILKQGKRVKFDETVEVHMWLGVDINQADQLIRGSVSLPHGLGKTKRVVVFCQGDNVAKAKEAGADFAGADDLIEKIQKQGWLDFDVALATQDMMGKVSRLGKVLGPRGLMPTPKAGTVIAAGQDVVQAVREQKAGKVEYRTDKGGNVHAGVGKLSFEEDKIVGNVVAFVEQIRSVKPAGVKGHYIKSITLSATMSPGIPISV